MVCSTITSDPTVEFRKKITVQKCGLAPSKETEVPPTWALKRRDQRTARSDDAFKTGIVSPWFTGVGISGMSRHLKTLVVARRQTLDNGRMPSQPGTDTIQSFLPFSSHRKALLPTVPIQTLCTHCDNSNAFTRFYKEENQDEITLPLPSKNNACSSIYLYFWTFPIVSSFKNGEKHSCIHISGTCLSYQPSLHKGYISA